MPHIQPNIHLPTNTTIKICSIILNQTGTNDPIQTILHDTLKPQITWARSSTGVWLGTTVNDLIPEKSQLWISNQNNVYTKQSIYLINSKLIQIAQYNINTTSFEDGLLNFPITIMQYNI